MHNSLTSEEYHYLRPNATTAEITSNSDALTSFNSDGFTIGSDGVINENTYTYVAWCWKAGGSFSAQTDGTIDTSRSVNTTAGFSIATYTGNATNGATRGHGLGVVPHMIMVKNRTDAVKWYVYHHKNTAAPETDYLALDSDGATTDQAGWNDTAPTSTLVTTSDGSEVNASGKAYVMYSWTGIQGFSKFGSYEGNGNADGPFVYTGFRPAMVILKKTSGTGGWYMYDIKRPGRNNENGYLQANSASAEDTNSGNFGFDILSNGFKLRGTYTTINESGGTFVYMAWACLLYTSDAADE